MPSSAAASGGSSTLIALGAPFRRRLLADRSQVA
jgi:hypothetical protein